MNECEGCLARGDLDECLSIACHSKETSGLRWLVDALKRERMEAIYLAQRAAMRHDRVAQRLRAVTQGRARC